MLRKITFAAVYLAPVTAFAGGGGSYTDGPLLLVQAASHLFAKLAGWF
jgi:hypothetical protein